MSIASSTRKSISSPSETKGKAVRFRLAYNLKSLLLDFVNERDRKLYEEFVCHIRDVGQEIRDDDLTQLLKEARGCVSILDGNLRLFVQVVLILKWTHRSDEVVSEYQGFLLDLCSAHNYYTKLVLEHLITSFKPGDDSSEWEDCKPSETEENQMQHIHHVIKCILNVIPMSHEMVLSSIAKNYPYLKKCPHVHETYVYNLIQLGTYVPSLLDEILSLIINKLIGIDVHTPKAQELCKIDAPDELMEVEDVFRIEDVGNCDPLLQALDSCMTVMMRFMQRYCHDPQGHFVMDKAKSLYGVLFKIFENVILPTHAAHHVQFLVFYFLSFKPSLAESFLRMLWRKVTNPNIAPIIRQSAVFYIASLVARATYISISLLQDVLNELNSWIHSYIDCQDSTGVAQDTRMHGVFYATCQAMFYVIAFRYRELINTQKGLVFLQGLNLGKIVTCRLNPLRVCQPAVVSNFAAIARAYQLAYCYTIMERNSRSALPQVHRDTTGAITCITQVYLDSFFPFDPYNLKKSQSYIEPLYKEYSNLSEEMEVEHLKTKDEDEDDFLESTSFHEAPVSQFSYSTSPGFLQF